MAILRAALTLTLIAGFYAFALAFALALEASGVLLFGAAMHAPGRVGLLAFIAATVLMALGWVLAYSLWPRRHRFRAPGPELYATQHKQLFKELARVAAFADSAIPDHVYLLAGADAYVQEVGGILGVGRKRVMGIGLLLLNVLTVSELRAVLTHEMGHFLAGDTRLGAWLHRGRHAAQQTLINLSDANDLIDHPVAETLIWLVALPFAWFLPFYLRISHAQMRFQELAADQLAVRLEGTEPFCEGLSQSVRVATVFPAYVAEKLAPILATGHLPALGQGFREFFASDEGQHLAARGLAVERATPLQQYDSHPPLAERLERARTLAVPARSKDTRLAIELLSDVTTMERVLAKDWPRNKPPRARAA